MFLLDLSLLLTKLVQMYLKISFMGELKSLYLKKKLDLCLFEMAFCWRADSGPILRAYWVNSGRSTCSKSDLL